MSAEMRLLILRRLVFPVIWALLIGNAVWGHWPLGAPAKVSLVIVVGLVGAATHDLYSRRHS